MRGNAEIAANNRHGHRWAIVLAGGEGTRMQPLIEHWLGHNRPKQYCAFIGTRTMLQHTADRAAALVGRERVVTVIGNGHGSFLQGPQPTRVRGALLEQPADRGTAVGILFPLAHILARDPEATVLVLPSDHYVFPEARFLAHASRACAIAEEYGNDIVLVGADPDAPETDYGWISPYRRELHPAYSPDHFKVDEFHEKPNRLEAERLFRAGALWNTMVVAARARALWAVAHECLPEIMQVMEFYLDILRGGRRRAMANLHAAAALAQAYADVDSADFSRDIIQQAPHRIRVMPLRGVQWSDWGRPERVQRTLDELGITPAFSRASLDLWRRAMAQHVMATG